MLELPVASLALLLLLPNQPPTVESARAAAAEAFQLREAGRFAEAETLYRQVLPQLAAALGPDHPDYAVALHNLGRIRARLGDQREALRLHEDALGRLKRALGPAHQLSRHAAANLAELHIARREFQRAAPLLTLALQDEPAGVRQASWLEMLAWVEYKRKRVTKAIELQERSVALRRAHQGPASLEAACASIELASLEFHARRYQDAARRFAETIPVLESHWGPGNPRLVPPLSVWEQVLLRQQDFASAARIQARVTGLRVRAALRP